MIGIPDEAKLSRGLSGEGEVGMKVKVCGHTVPPFGGAVRE